jgi:hypothetical protein
MSARLAAIAALDRRTLEGVPARRFPLALRLCRRSGKGWLRAHAMSQPLAPRVACLHPLRPILRITIAKLDADFDRAVLSFEPFEDSPIRNAHL